MSATSTTSRDTLDPSAFNTSLDTKATSGTQPGVDSQKVHRFRDQVARVLLPDWEKRARALANCGRGAVAMYCGACGLQHRFPFRCGARTCPVCARKAAAAVTDRLAKKIREHDKIIRLESWDGPGPRQLLSWKFLTLTRPAAPDVDARFVAGDLRSIVKDTRSLVRAFWRSTVWGRQVRDPSGRKKRSRRDTSYVMAEEVSPQGMVHVHLAVFGEFILQRELQGIWSKAVGCDAIVHIQTVHGIADAIREVIKYATKGHCGFPAPERAAAVELAFKHVRRLGVGGRLHGLRRGETCEDWDDALPRDLHNQGVAECVWCGMAGAWDFGGQIRADMVAQYGGFTQLPARRRETVPLRGVRV